MGYMQLGGLNKYMSAMNAQQGGSGDYQLYGDFPYASAKFTFDEGNVEPQPNPTGKLYDGLTMEQIEEYLYEAGILSGLGDKFDPTNH